MGGAFKLKEASASAIRSTIDAATAAPGTQIPGAVFVAVNRAGEELLAHASGLRGVDAPQEPMTLDSVFWIASCTKMIGGIACMQLVEAGTLRLDDHAQAAELAPELSGKKILKGFDAQTGKPVLEDAKGGVTLRQLLSHTAGFGYTFFNPELKKYGFPKGIDEFSGSIEDIDTPLLFEPGTKWNYGTNVDWAGILVERATGLSLNDYCQEKIFGPLGITNINFFPTPEMKAQLAHMHARAPDGAITTREHLLRRPIVTTDPAERKKILNSAGAGCFAQPREYAKIIATLLNDGTSPHTGRQILQKATVDQMFSNQIPTMPDFGRQPIAAATPALTNPIAELYPQPPEQPQGWGLTFMLTLHPGATGRGSNTGWWAGLPNLFWWADRERGVGGMIASQIVPFGDPQVMGLWAQCEMGIYQGEDA